MLLGIVLFVPLARLPAKLLPQTGVTCQCVNGAPELRCRFIHNSGSGLIDCLSAPSNVVNDGRCSASKRLQHGKREYFRRQGRKDQGGRHFIQRNKVGSRERAKESHVLTTGILLLQVVPEISVSSDQQVILG